MSTSTSSLTSTSPPTPLPVNGSSSQSPHPLLENNDEKNSVVIKVGMVGDSQIGKTSLMVKYVEGSFDEDYIQTLGVNFMEKTISVRRTTITFSIWDLGGQREFVNMLPLVCNDAVAILFMFDLSRKSTLNSVKEWYRQARGFNKTAIPFLIGTKFDQFATFPRDEQEEITKQAKRFARAMHASLIFCSTSASINVQKIFKIVLAKAFDLKCVIPEIEGRGRANIPFWRRRGNGWMRFLAVETDVGLMGEKTKAKEHAANFHHTNLNIGESASLKRIRQFQQGLLGYSSPHSSFVYIGYFISRPHTPYFIFTISPTSLARHLFVVIPIFLLSFYAIVFSLCCNQTCIHDLPSSAVFSRHARAKNWHHFLNNPCLLIAWKSGVIFFYPFNSIFFTTLVGFHTHLPSTQIHTHRVFFIHPYLAHLTRHHLYSLYLWSFFSIHFMLSK